MELRGVVGDEGVESVPLRGVIGANRLIALFVPGTQAGPVFALGSAGEFFLDVRRRASEDEVLPWTKKPRLVANDTPGRRSAGAVESGPWRGLDVDSSVRRGSMVTYRETTEERALLGGQRDRGQAGFPNDRDQRGCRTARRGR